MRLLTQEQVAQIETILGRPLASEEKREFARLGDICDEGLAVARSIFAEDRPLALKYLLELVPGTRLGLATRFLEDVVAGGADPRQWSR